MANRINYTDKVALNARTEIADINKHTAADDNEIKNVVNAHATNIETLEANQTSGVVRADTIVDEGDGRSFLPVTGDVTTAYIVDGEVSPVEIKNGNYRWDGAAYTKTAYQTVAGSKTDLATNGSQDVFTSQGAFNLDADLQGQIHSNDVEIAQNISDIAQNISDIAQNTLDITQNESDIADNQTRLTDTENILLVGSDAYTHAERGVVDGFTTERLVQLDNEIESNLDADFYFKAGHSKGAGKIGIAVPDVSAADLSISRNSNATFVNKRGLIETALPNVPRFDWSSGEPVLLTEPEAENQVEDSAGGDYGNAPASETLTQSPQGLNNAVIPTVTATANRYEYTIAPNTYSTNDSIVYSWYRKRISTPVLSSSIGDLDVQFSTVNTSFVSSAQIGSNINGFDRFEAVFTVNDGSLESKLRGYFGAIIGLGNSSVAYFGHQVEVGNKATSYIPTNGATAVRLADTGIKTGDISQYIDSEEGVLEFEIQAFDNGGSTRKISLSDGTGYNRIFISAAYTPDFWEIGIEGSNGGLFTTNFATNIDQTNKNKIKLKWKSGDIGIKVNDVEVFTSNNSFIMQTLRFLNLANNSSTDRYMYAKTFYIKIYDSIDSY